MGIIPVDLTRVGVKDGSFEAVIHAVDYIVKTGEKWNKAGMSKVAFDEWLGFADELRGLNLLIKLPEQGNQVVFHKLFMAESSLPFVERVFTAAGVEFEMTGFDPDLLVGRPIGVKVVLSAYGPQISSFYKV